MQTGSSEHHSPDDRSRRIQLALDEFRSLLDAGTSVDDDEFCRSQSDLMPELGVQLRMLRRIRGIEISSGVDLGARLEPVFGDDGIRTFLQENLTQYTIQDAISRGGQGLVYRARQLNTHRDVAIKVLADGVFASRQQLERFMREIELAARLRHPNIVSIHDSGTIQNRPYCVMEYVDGEPIDGYILLEKPDLSARIALFSKICRAVSYAHQRGVIHRDLKPANIVVDQEGEPRLLDFGLAKDAFATEASGAGLSMQGQIIGTLHYLSPEQVRGDPAEIDVRTDIYAMGIVFYQVLTGSFPYPVLESYDTARENILECTPIPIKGLPEPATHGIDLRAVDGDVEAILRKALEKDKDRRYQSADAMAEDFERFLRGEVVGARADTRFYVLRKTIRRHRIQLAVASGFVVMATIATIISTTLYFRAVFERDRADNSSNLAHSLVGQIASEIDNEVSRLPGGRATRNRINKGVEPSLKELAENLNARGGVEFERAQVDLNLGRIAEQTGQREEARGHFESAINLLSLKESKDLRHVALRIEAMIALGGIDKNPTPILEQAVSLASRHTSAEKFGDQFRVLLGEAYVQIGQRANESGDRRAAAEAVDHAIGYLEGVKSLVRDGVRCRQAIVDAHRLGGGVRHWLGDCDESDRHFADALEMLDQLLIERPWDALARFQRMRIQVEYAGFAKEARSRRAAIAHLDPVIEDAEWLCQANPGEFEWVRALVIAYLNRATSTLKMNPDSARTTLARCEALLSELRKYAEGDDRIRELDAVLYTTKGKLSINSKSYDEGAELYRRAYGIYVELDAAHVDNIRTREMLSYCLRAIGESYEKLHMDSDAIACLAEYSHRRLCEYESDKRSVVQQVDYLKSRIAFQHQLTASGNRDELAFALCDAFEVMSILERLQCDEMFLCHLPSIVNALNDAEKSVSDIKSRIAELD
jgi:serine/threonine protein kinase